jgi:hypothetical protein
MTSSYDNLALFIKRAEEHQTEEVIARAFANNNIGKVKEVMFIKKQNACGQPYNGVIVIFERWNKNTLVEKLLNEMSASPDGTTRFYFDNTRYWIINIHKQKMSQCEETTFVDPALPDREKVATLEELLKSMSAQMHYSQLTQEKLESRIADLEQKETHHQLVNMELRSELEHTTELFNNLITNSEHERRGLCERIREKDALIGEMERDITDNQCIISYMEQQVQDMKTMLLGVLDTDPIKDRINEYIKYYVS